MIKRKKLYKRVRICYDVSRRKKFMLTYYKNVEKSDHIVIQQKSEGTDTNFNRLIINPKEIVFLEKDGKIKINKCKDNSNKKEGYNVVYNYDKFYLDSRENIHGYSLSSTYFYRASDRAFQLSDAIMLDERYLKSEVKINYLNREQIENVFNSENYDSMYILWEGKILYAHNKVDGLVVDKKIIPSDEEIIEKECKERESLFDIFGKTEKTTYKVKRKELKDIHNFNLYTPAIPLFANFVHTLITSKDDIFKVCHFSVVYKEENVFELKKQEIEMDVPTVDDIILNLCDDKDLRTVDMTPKMLQKQQEN